MRFPLMTIAWGYIIVAVILPLGALLLTSMERFATVIIPQMQFTLANYETALRMGSLAPAFANSLILGVSVATLGVPTIGVLAWIIYRSRVPGRGLMEFVIMIPAAVPRLVFGLGLLWAWINIPIPIYGTLWLLASRTSQFSCHWVCVPSPVSYCRSIQAWRNVHVFAVRHGDIKCGR